MIFFPQASEYNSPFQFLRTVCKKKFKTDNKRGKNCFHNDDECNADKIHSFNLFFDTNVGRLVAV